ncbi:LPP20 lipoprotein [Cyclonatronum proteinivorum]|uniref:LPP20 lipoprotein n=1 Tax=Cyclonatronum proteinivorum TaxID=1457365 RepID=A0A345UPM1_9BACT|nr:LPP20 family lipoprotein [Cyclonatronum proteinivorum]AXJ02423.1 LPP20 lipoprotein [Cyclonatronum proteinivorum]
MKQLFTIPLTLALSIMLISCASTPRTPQWLTSPGDVYPDQQYLTAIGSGSSLQAAQDNAAGNLARTFRADVQASQTLVDDFLETMQGEDVNLNRITSLISTTQVTSDLEMLNVQMYETHRSPEGTYYVLIGFERLPTSIIYSREITSNDMVIESIVGQAERDNSVIRKMGFYRAALTISRVNENLSQQRDLILARSVPFNTETERRLEIERKLDELADQATVEIHTSDDFPRELDGALRGAFQELGFRTGEGVGSALLNVRADFLMEDTDLGRTDAHFKHWSLTVDIQDTQTRTDFSSFFREGRTGAATEDQASRRTARDARAAVERPFKTFLEAQLRELIRD